MTDPNDRPTVDKLIAQWKDGELMIAHSDKIEDVDGYTVQVYFDGSNGSLVLTFSLDAGMSYIVGRGDGSENINIEHYEPQVNR